MKVMIEYLVIGVLTKYPEVSREVYVPEDWNYEKIKTWYEDRHHNIGGKGILVVNIVKV